ncbi:hypothetical protein HU200_065700 [Digitaria exilis]|uniref:Uncharacterized protein n=1 Tax=Digitaria exilis TaxID=1010633 RepID=A0A834ZXP1_9POAL|nr:hypothetical protein HU200_065700 [Digitaria exilis]
MPRLRSRAKAAAAASPPSPPPAADGSQDTPTPSPSTSLRLGIGPASPDDGGFGAGSLGLKSPTTAAPPRRSLRLAGSAGGDPRTPAALEGGSSGSGSGPSTSLRLGIGPASPDDGGFGAASLGLKSPAAAPPRRSLRLAGSAGGDPTNPAAPDGGSSGSGGSVKSTGRARARVSASSPASASARDFNSGSDDGGSGAADRGSSGMGDGSDDAAAPFISLRSGSRIAKRRMEAAGQVDGEAGPGSSDGGQVHDEMPHRGGGTPTKRWKSIVVGGVKTDYVADSESEDEEDCVMLRQNVVYVADSESGSDKDCVMLEQNDVKMPGAQVPAGPSGMEPNAVAMKMDWTEEDAKDDPGKAGNGESGGVFEQSTYPAGSASSPKAEMFADMYFKEELGQYNPRKDGNAKKKLVLGNNNSREPGPDPQDWPGPFATAARVYEEREAKLRARELNSSKAGKSASKVIVWSPSKDRKIPDLQLDISGRCMPDYILPTTLAKDLRNLNRLRDSALKHLRNGCRLIRKLKLQRNTFSDEAVSQYLEESGGCLTELMLNNVEKVGYLTAFAISRKCSVRLEALDLSFCRELTNEALGLIVESCPSLRILKLFGCTQITDFFLKGHSNTLVKIIGIEGNILDQMDHR